MTMVWNISEAIFRLSESSAAERPALIHGDKKVSFKQLIQRTSGIASWLQSLQLPKGAHVGHYMRNSNAYMETFTAAGLAGMAHVNVNYRYREQELVDLCTSLDIRVLVYDREFAERVAVLQDKLTTVVAYVEVGASPCENTFANALESLYAFDASNFERACSSDDLILLATGGTTGLPKGVMWRHEDIWRKQMMSTGGALSPLKLQSHPKDIAEHIENVLSLPEPGVFKPMPTTTVLDDQMQEVTPGSDTIGIAYSGGYIPLGYYNQPEKSAETFVIHEDTRYVKTGDRCTVREDGMLMLLGRDSTVINTGGEKVYTVEVERALLSFPAIDDALVVGLPHPKFGKVVVAVVEGQGLTVATLDIEAVQAHTRDQLADYKVPRKVYAIDSLQRADNGKPDYTFVTGYAQAQLDEESGA
jgi:acyl-CoA synthetase (AMP-forming)/AMP-acid ligase II